MGEEPIPGLTWISNIPVLQTMDKVQHDTDRMETREQKLAKFSSQNQTHMHSGACTHKRWVYFANRGG